MLGFLRSRDKSPKPRKKAAPQPAGPSLLARLRASAADLRARAGTAAIIAGRVAVAMVFVAMGVAWVLGREPLERRVAAISAAPQEIRFNWPVTSDPKARRTNIDPRETWLPAPVRDELVSIARQHADADPFLQISLEAMRCDLAATGWFARLRSVERDASGNINILGDWRIPTAVVRHERREYLVARGGEVLKLPPRTPVAPGTLPVITAPLLPPPEDQGMIAYGKPWAGGDVTAALDLLRILQGIPESKRLRGVDLAHFMDKGHLVLVTDAGSRIVWGSAIGESSPGEVPFEKRRGRLRDILAQRFDVEQSNIAIYTPVVLVDKTFPQQ